MNRTYTIPEIPERVEFRRDACRDCLHWDAEHLVHIGPVRLCMASGCSCGRRTMARFAHAIGPWCPVFAAMAYLAYHLALWASRGFLVRGW